MRVLVVDDEPGMLRALSDYFKPEGIETSIAPDGLSGRKLLEEEPFDALVTDLRMPGLDGLGLLRWVREEGPPLPVIVISAHGEVDDAVTAMKLGAYDYLVKPFDPDELLIRIRKAVAGRRIAARLEAGMGKGVSKRGLIGESSAMNEVQRLLARAAPSPATILITGESGTGKEVAARSVHDLSGREGPFVPVNMGAFPEQLLESELFGYEKGAFTGAEIRRAGMFESAHGGTLFLDEIAELPLHLQVKLLRAVQERKVQRLGAVRGIPVDIRLVAATNRDLEAEVRAGRFREDLYYRLNVIRISMPPLRERSTDIPLLAGHFLARFNAELGRKIEGIDQEALELLEAYPFPGNVRELENAIERAVIMSDDVLLRSRDFATLALQSLGRVTKPGAAGESGAVRLPIPGGGTADRAPDPSGPASLADIERQAIVASLARNTYLREKTASELGITRRTLLNKIREYDITIPDGRDHS